VERTSGNRSGNRRSRSRSLNRARTVIDTEIEEPSMSLANDGAPLMLLFQVEVYETVGNRGGKEDVFTLLP